MTLITLDNQPVIPVTWGKAALCDLSQNNQVDIWRIEVSPNLPHIDALLNVLTPQEVTRADNYHRALHREQFIISRGALRHILSGYLKQSAADIQFKMTKNRKPFVIQPEGPQLHFNLSDSAGCVVVAVAAQEVGIDVEYIKPDFAYEDIMHHNFNEPEIEYIKQERSMERFFLLWTRKEAILKATGIGLTDHLKQITALEGQHSMDGELLSTQTNWQLHSFEPFNNYIATIASGSPANIHRFFGYGS